MQLKFAFLLAVLALVGAEEEATCGEEQAAKCMLKLMSDLFEEASDEQDCKSLAEASSCLREAAEDCTGEASNGDIENGRTFLRSLAAVNCPQKDLPDEVEECVNDLESEFMECIEDGVAEVLTNLIEHSEETEVDEDAIKCQMYESIAKCVIPKVSDNCGEEASISTLAEMMDDDELKEACKFSDVHPSIREAFFDLSKKRK